jgi:putative transposase
LIRRECLDRILITGERHLATVLDQYTAHYKRPPTTSFFSSATAPRHDHNWPIGPPLRCTKRPILGGLINEYVQAAWPNRVCEPHKSFIESAQMLQRR